MVIDAHPSAKGPMNMKKISSRSPQRTFKTRILRLLYTRMPFNLKGDMPLLTLKAQKDTISCIICTRRDPGILKSLLTDLAGQTLSKDQFEVIIYDNTPSGNESLAEEFSPLLKLHQMHDATPSGMIGQFRNTALTHAHGEYILFLDDDTRLPQRDFLSLIIELFNTQTADILMPQGKGLSLDKDPRYHFLDTYSFAARCCCYKRSLLEQLGGFRKDITAYEDIDLGIRVSMMNAIILKTDRLCYEHPPLFFISWKKPVAIGQSVLCLRRHYPFYLWLIIYFNALRFLSLLLWPTTQNRQWAKISIGVLIAPFQQRKETYHP